MSKEDFILSFFLVDISFTNCYLGGMEITSITLLFVGVILGALIVYLVLSKGEKKAEIDKSVIRDAFASLSVEALEKSTNQFLKLANETLKVHVEKGDANLKEKKKLIDANLGNMATVLEDLKKQSLSLSTQLSESQKETDKLRITTEDLRNVLSSSQARGQWGERMVEDILSLVGFAENINYVKQQQIESGEKPDYTFFLPKDKRINMDVKFPLNHYEKYVSSESEIEREQEQKMFMNDVKGHIKDVASRGYIDPLGGTVDYVLLFIPNESIYAFLHQNDPDIQKIALEKHIVLCSPITLYAVLSLIHQTISSFAVEEKTGQIMTLLREFDKQWLKFVASMEKMGRSIDTTRSEYEKLTSTRTRQLEKPLSKIRDIELGQNDSGLLSSGVDDPDSPTE